MRPASGRYLLPVLVAAVIAIVVGVAANVSRQSDDVDRPVDVLPHDVLPYSAPDVVNPMRGQFENILTGLFPQSNEANRDLPAWPGARDASLRFTWRSLQPVDPADLPADAPDDQRYDFSQIAEALDSYDRRGMRVGLRISSYDSCCEQLPPGSANIGVPDWVAAQDGAVDRYERDGTTQVIPDWNSAAYLGGFSALLEALGRRYDGDERLAIFEMSGYGDFSENVLPVLRDDLGAPGPEEGDSEAVLGYYSQYRDQFITAVSAKRLVAANLSAFRRTQMVTAPGNPQIVKELMRDSEALRDVVHPVGVRGDCLGLLEVVPTWATDVASEYVKRADPIIDTLEQRLVDAPVVTEWCQLPDGDSPSAYYRRALHTVIDEHVSMTASSGFPDRLADAAMKPELYDLWSRANIYAGYRYDATATMSAGPSGVTGVVDWTNRGVSSTHERWAVRYQLRSDDGAVVAETDSDLDLRTIDIDQDSDATTPTASVATDPVTFDGPLDAGTYTVTVAVSWDEHKAAAIHTVDLPPMNLAMRGRADGVYEIGRVRVD
jgi:hypothetical protein